MILAELFLSFLWVGAFSFGGGYGAIPLIRDVVLSRGWMTEESLSRMIAISESTPGPIVVNLATYVGSTQAGIPGSAAATFAVVLPSFFVIILVLVVLKNLMKNRYVQAALAGMQPCVVGIILATGLTMTLRTLFPEGNADWRALAIGGILLGLTAFCAKRRKKGISPTTLILISAVLGMVLYGI